ncbi:MAG: ROK family protein [Verrucomicrobia bacterium]|nr:MAG: ROK family protein [Verrucomicrobiota bacterium]
MTHGTSSTTRTSPAGDGSTRSLWGIDLGGTKIEGVILDQENPAPPLHRLRVPTESSKGYVHILNQIEAVISQLETASGMKRPNQIGVGSPGITSPLSGLLKNSNTLCLNGKNLAQDLNEISQSRFLMANDANCCALAEATLGSARDQKTVFGIILGTGVGGGIVVDKQVLVGAHGICGEWGHNPLRGEETLCYCGRRGCIETVCSGPALETFYESLCGDRIPLREIALRALSGDTPALTTLKRLQAKFAEGLGAIINILDPDAIVIGGGVGNLDLLYTDETREAIHTHLFNDRFDTPLLRPALGDSAGVFGAAMLSADAAMAL